MIKTLTLIVLLLLLMLPVVGYKFNCPTDIFPAVEIIVMFYFGSHFTLSSWQAFLIGLFFDQLYLMPLGTNALIFLIGTFSLEIIKKLIYIKEYATNCCIFFGYALLIILVRAGVMMSKEGAIFYLAPIFFQYLTTVFLYPIVKVIFDKFSRLKERNAAF